MAIKFEDKKDEKPANANGAATKRTVPQPAGHPSSTKEAEDDAPVLPFAKPIRPDKKKRGS